MIANIFWKLPGDLGKTIMPRFWIAYTDRKPVMQERDRKGFAYQFLKAREALAWQRSRCETGREHPWNFINRNKSQHMKDDMICMN